MRNSPAFLTIIWVARLSLKPQEMRKVQSFLRSLFSCAGDRRKLCYLCHQKGHSVQTNRVATTIHGVGSTIRAQLADTLFVSPWSYNTGSSYIFRNYLVTWLMESTLKIKDLRMCITSYYMLPLHLWLEGIPCVLHCGHFLNQDKGTTIAFWLLSPIFAKHSPLPCLSTRPGDLPVSVVAFSGKGIPGGREAHRSWQVENVRHDVAEGAWNMFTHGCRAECRQRPHLTITWSALASNKRF